MPKWKLLLTGSFIGVFVVVILVVLLPYTASKVMSDSMLPDIAIGDLVIAYSAVQPKHNDIVVFYKEFETENGTYTDHLVKRVAGIGGDYIEVVDHDLYLNGELLCSWSGDSVEDDFKYVVPDNSFFVIGDNLDNSFDSRQWDNPFVGIDDISGVVVKILPFGRE